MGEDTGREEYSERGIAFRFFMTPDCNFHSRIKRFLGVEQTPTSKYSRFFLKVGYNLYAIKFTFFKSIQFCEF